MINLNRALAVARMTFGCDPEIFFENGSGKIVGAEKVIGKGISGIKTYGKIDLDGVQGEIKTNPSTCREVIAGAIKDAFGAANRHLKGTNYKVSFRGVVDVDQDELNSLSPEARQLGCAPSLNYYDDKASIGVDPATYTKRSAGGHIHIGTLGLGTIYQQPARVIPIMDICVGNTAVLLDRDPLAAERRKVYGRAGEYRTQTHGFEYRTLSNFWLRSYPVMSMMFGLSRMAVSIIQSTLNGNDLESELMARVDLHKVREAINNNDFNMALDNYIGFRDFVETFVKAPNTCINHENLEDFDYFIKVTSQKGLEFWFYENPIEHWMTRFTQDTNEPKDPKVYLSTSLGAERFLREVVQNHRKLAESKEKADENTVRVPGFVGEGELTAPPSVTEVD